MLQVRMRWICEGAAGRIAYFVKPGRIETVQQQNLARLTKPQGAKTSDARWMFSPLFGKHLGDLEYVSTVRWAMLL
jgi:hypothetical protein